MDSLNKAHQKALKELKDQRQQLQKLKDKVQNLQQPPPVATAHRHHPTFVGPETSQAFPPSGVIGDGGTTATIPTKNSSPRAGDHRHNSGDRSMGNRSVGSSSHGAADLNGYAGEQFQRGSVSHTPSVVSSCSTKTSGAIHTAASGVVGVGVESDTSRDAAAVGRSMGGSDRMTNAVQQGQGQGQGKAGPIHAGHVGKRTSSSSSSNTDAASTTGDGIRLRNQQLSYLLSGQFQLLLLELLSGNGEVTVGLDHLVSHASPPVEASFPATGSSTNNLQGGNPLSGGGHLSLRRELQSVQHELAKFQTQVSYGGKDHAASSRTLPQHHRLLRLLSLPLAPAPITYRVAYFAFIIRLNYAHSLLLSFRFAGNHE